MIRAAIRPVVFALAIALGVAAMVPVADAPAPDGPAPDPTRPGHLVPGGMMRTVLVLGLSPLPAAGAGPSSLDRIADAVEGAESSHGRDRLMWRADPRGPQGPMQVTHLAAVDVGGGDRFDLAQNRELGRAYLARMYERYGNWRDTLLAYNWGPGNLDLWIRAGRPEDRLGAGLTSYVHRVLSESAAEGAPIASRLPSGDAVRAPERARPPSHPDVREETIADRGLRDKVADNNRLIARLRLFLDAAAPARPGGAGYAKPTLEWMKSAEIDPEKLTSADLASQGKLRQAGAKLVLAITRDVSRRPGYANFKFAKVPLAEPDLAASRLIGSLLLAKLEEANDTLALIDAHRRAGGSQARKPGRSGTGAAGAGMNRATSG